MFFLRARAMETLEDGLHFLRRDARPLIAYGNLPGSQRNLHLAPCGRKLDRVIQHDQKHLPKPPAIQPNLKEFQALLERQKQGDAVHAR